MANERHKDAHGLLRIKRYNGAVYLGGYAIECLLKVAVCDYLGVDRLPAAYAIHDLRRLADAAKVLTEIEQDARLRALF